MKRQKSEHGSVLLFVAGIILPMLFLLFSLSADIGMYYRETRRIQKLTDQAALYAYRYLPFQSAAEAAARSFLEHDTAVAGSAKIRVTPNEVEIYYEGGARPGFSSFLKAAGATVAAYSKAVGTPFDVALYLDVSSYLAPDLLTGKPAGSEVEWPAASFFRNEYQPQALIGGKPVKLCPRLLTQQCFNPALSPLKEGFVRIYEYSASFPANQVGAFVFPGRVLPVDTIKPVSPSASADGGGEAAPPSYAGPYVSSAHCLAAAERERSEEKYRFLRPNESLGGRGDDSGPRPPPFMIHPSTYGFNPDYAPFFSVKDAIWGNAARQGLSWNIKDVVESVRSELVASPVLHSRKALGRHIERRAVLLAGELPLDGGKRFPAQAAEASLREAISALQGDADRYGVSVELYYVLYPVRGRQAVEDDFDRLLRLFSALETDRVRLKAALSGSKDDLIENVVGMLGVARKNAVLWR